MYALKSAYKPVLWFLGLWASIMMLTLFAIPVTKGMTFYVVANLFKISVHVFSIGLAVVSWSSDFKIITFGNESIPTWIIRVFSLLIAVMSIYIMLTVGLETDKMTSF